MQKLTTAYLLDGNTIVLDKPTGEMGNYQEATLILSKEDIKGMYDELVLIGEFEHDDEYCL